MNNSLKNIDNATNNRNYSHAVCRSAELLSCAKTAVKIALSRMHQNSTNGTTSHGTTGNSDWILNLNPSELKLYNHDKQHQNSPLNGILDDGLEILDVMESELRLLNELVRRRGHSNDPTQEISTSVATIERDVAELTSIVQAMVSRGSIGQQQNQQRQRHIKVIQEWFQAMIQHYATQLKDILSVRATVLSEQARRRGMFQPSKNTRNGATAAAVLSTINSSYNHNNVSFVTTNEAQNALFAPLPQPSRPLGINLSQRQQPSLPNVDATQHTGGYGGSYYTQSNSIGTDSTTAESGIRRRKQQNSTTFNGGVSITENSNPGSSLQQHQITVQQNRQTSVRLKEARQAEQSLAALGSIFGKMSTLIVQQSETLSKIEDDVEAANVDVTAGHNEITTLYSIKKGNRMLIIKVYSLLIFLIIFMRFYAKK